MCTSLDLIFAINVNKLFLKKLALIFMIYYYTCRMIVNKTEASYYTRHDDCDECDGDGDESSSPAPVLRCEAQKQKQAQSPVGSQPGTQDKCLHAETITIYTHMLYYAQTLTKLTVSTLFSITSTL